jgi:hypothetical protein
MTHLGNSVVSIVFYRVFGQCWLPRNKVAYVQAKAAALHETLAFGKVFDGVFCPRFQGPILSSWQDELNNAEGNKLLVLKPYVQEWQFSFKVVRKDDVTLTCFRISHTRLTHGHLLFGKSVLLCKAVVSNLRWHTT